MIYQFHVILSDTGDKLRIGLEILSTGVDLSYLHTCWAVTEYLGRQPLARRNVQTIIITCFRRSVQVTMTQFILSG